MKRLLLPFTISNVDNITNVRKEVFCSNENYVQNVCGRNLIMDIALNTPAIRLDMVMEAAC